MTLFELPEPEDPHGNAVEELFTFWKETFGKNARTQLDDTRRKKLTTAVKAYGLTDCRKAILGCSVSPWHNGRNPGNKMYTDVTLIFRNADKVEGFVELWEQHDKSNSELQEWMNT